VWLGETPDPWAVPSPQFQSYDATVPSGSDEPEPSTETVRPFVDVVNAAFGAVLVTWTVRDDVFVPPWLSVTVSATV